MKIIDRLKKMKELGIYQTDDGREYDCYFVSESKIAKAIGPLPKPDQVGARGVAYKVMAYSEQEARKNLMIEIGKGRWV